MIRNSGVDYLLEIVNRRSITIEAQQRLLTGDALVDGIPLIRLLFQRGDGSHVCQEYCLLCQGQLHSAPQHMQRGVDFEGSFRFSAYAHRSDMAAGRQSLYNINDINPAIFTNGKLCSSLCRKRNVRFYPPHTPGLTPHFHGLRCRDDDCHCCFCMSTLSPTCCVESNISLAWPNSSSCLAMWDR